jgi:hypothetical protein
MSLLGEDGDEVEGMYKWYKWHLGRESMNF